jgi:plastocyanin domain-containing protein
MGGVMGFMLLVDVLGLAVIGFIVWWFWLYKPRAVRSADPAAPIEITVADGVYTPARIELPAGQPLVLRFLRRDPGPCAEQLQFADLGISVELPLNKAVDVALPAQPAGEYGFSCQMQMYRGTLIIK